MNSLDVEWPMYWTKLVKHCSYVSNHSLEYNSRTVLDMTLEKYRARFIVMHPYNSFIQFNDIEGKTEFLLAWDE